MRYQAVIFDLFGTLVPTPTGLYEDDHRRTAALLGADGEAYVQAYYEEEMALKRATGVFPDIPATIKAVCEKLGVDACPAVLTRAAVNRMETTRRALQPRPDALETLDALRGLGLKLGMMSDCTCEVPLLWPETPFAERFDEALFSCDLGMKKPDPRFYELMCEKLAVPAERFLFVGDAGCAELTGAREVGMEAALICPPDEAQVIMARQEARNWHGPQIAALSEVLNLLQ